MKTGSGCSLKTAKYEGRIAVDIATSTSWVTLQDWAALASIGRGSSAGAATSADVWRAARPVNQRKSKLSQRTCYPGTVCAGTKMVRACDEVLPAPPPCSS